MELVWGTGPAAEGRDPGMPSKDGALRDGAGGVARTESEPADLGCLNPATWSQSEKRLWLEPLPGGSRLAYLAASFTLSWSNTQNCI